MNRNFVVREIKSLKAQQVIAVVRRTLSFIDERLVNHGERVAFIIYRLLEYWGKLGMADIDVLMPMAVFHDIGAYKTDEIDNMLVFETDGYFNHSIYGYLFLKLLTPLKDSAIAVLHHHTDYTQVESMDFDYKFYAELLHLADRVDISVQNGLQPEEQLKNGRGTVFNPQMVDIFLEANESIHITDDCKNDSYKAFVEQLYSQISLPTTEVFDYLKMVVYAIDFRSTSTVTHTINTTAISISIARLSNLSIREIRHIGFGAFLHDIGKIAIPSSILESPERLSPEEMEIMKTHVSFTEKIIRGIVSDEVCDIAARHHEKLDGTGYPNGLTEKDLTYSQRILCISDIISALVGTRSYKAAYPKDKVLEILGNMMEAGKLDTKICQIVFDNYDEIMSNSQEYLRTVTTVYNQLAFQYSKLSKKYLKDV